MTERRADRVRAPVSLPGIAALEAVVEGSVVPRDSPVFEDVRKPAWAQFEDIAPDAVVLCMTTEDVAETITFARRVGAEIAARSGGHCFAGRSSTRGLLIDLSEMRSVTVTDGLATVEAGALLGDVYERLDSHGLTIAAGSCPSVGIAGLTLGGGLGILGRTHGLTSDQLVGARVVLADGRVVDCDEHREPDLFWALRGAGGGQFGIVTTFLFRTIPAEDLTCFKLGWPYAQAAAAVELWQDWAPDAPDELAASTRPPRHRPIARRSTAARARSRATPPRQNSSRLRGKRSRSQAAVGRTPGWRAPDGRRRGSDVGVPRGTKTS
jgi:FAD/FMN-containing dehydrogenase